MKRLIGGLLIVSLLVAQPPKAEARMGKGKAALIVGASVSALVAGAMIAKNDYTERRTGFGTLVQGPKKWTPIKIVVASAGSGIAAAGLLYVGLSVSSGKIRLRMR